MNVQEIPTSPETQKKPRLPLFSKIVYLLALISAVLYASFTLFPTFADWFNGTVSQAVRFVLAHLTSWIPFSVAELLLLLLPLFLFLAIWIGIRRFSDSNRAMLTYIGILLSILSLIFVLFVWSFAAGYYGKTLDEKLELERKKSSAEELYEVADLLSDELDALSDEILFLESGQSLMPYSISAMNDKLIDAYDRFCSEHDFMDSFSCNVKGVMLSVPMSYLHITGVYSFFTGEANLNINFPDYTLPFTAAHELAHQRGIAREDEANFVAFLICMESNDPYIRYSGTLSLFEYVASALYSADSELYRKLYLSLSTEILGEEQAYSEFFDQYRDNVAADISQSVNNIYLQSQGASEGTRSYGMVVDLAVAYLRGKTAP